MNVWNLKIGNCFDGGLHKAEAGEKGAGSGLWVVMRQEGSDDDPPQAEGDKKFDGALMGQNGSDDVRREVWVEKKGAGFGVDDAWNLEAVRLTLPRDRGGQARCCMHSLGVQYTHVAPTEPRMTTCY